jgi:site-specific recombinase XerD
MFLTKNHEQTILEISKGKYIAASVEAFLIDRRASELSKHTLEFYWHILNPFIEYCNASSIKFIGEITPDFLRHYFLAYAENHNPGGVHAAYRTLRVFFRWLIDEEIMPPEWKNPMLKVKPPRVVIEPLEPISIRDVRSLIDSCQRGTFIGERDRAIFLFLLDTGARAQEACNMNIKDIDLHTGSIMIRNGKGGKTAWYLLVERHAESCARTCMCDNIRVQPYLYRRIENG